MKHKSMTMDLIRRYVGIAAEYASKLRAELGHDDLLRAVNTRIVPREGVLSNGAQYHFHSVGCAIEDSSLSVDFHFGPEGRCDGFDAWRLWKLAQELPEFSVIRSLEVIKEHLEHLCTEGLVVHPAWNPSPHLYYLTPG